MTDFFDAIEYLFVEVLFKPFDSLREMELDTWFFANIINWLFVLIGFAALFYWLKQLKIFNDNNEENRDPKAHSFLG